MKKNGEFIQNLQGIVGELDAVLRRLKQRERKLGWEVELLDEKRGRIENGMKDSSSTIKLESEFFSFAGDKTIKKPPLGDPPPLKMEELKAKESALKSESQSLDLKERELYAKFTHMKEFYSNFLSKKTEFELKIPPKPASLNEENLRREQVFREKELLLSERQEKLLKNNEKLQEILKKLNAFYEENQNYQSETTSDPGIPKIRSFEPKKTHFRS